MHGIHPHTDLEAHSHSRSNGHTKGTEDPTASLHASALRTEKIAKFLEAHFGPVEIVETRGDSEEGDGDDVHMKPTKLLAFDPAILVRLDEWTARVGLVDLVRNTYLSRECRCPNFLLCSRSSNPISSLSSLASKLCWR